MKVVYDQLMPIGNYPYNFVTKLERLAEPLPFGSIQFGISSFGGFHVPVLAVQTY